MAAFCRMVASDIANVISFMEECKRMGLQKLLGPDVNESFYKFTVNEKLLVLGIGAVKGVGTSIVETIVANRKEAKYKSIFDLEEGIDLIAAIKKAFENLALAGGFDSFGNTTRAQIFS